MHRVILVIALVVTPALASMADSHESRDPLRVLMTVGGVGYHTSIVRMLQLNPGIALSVRDIDDERDILTPATLESADAVLMYHRDNVAEPAERQALIDYLANGGGVVVLHHSIANYPDWDEWWREHVGGLYVLAGHSDLQPSRYFLDFKGVARPTRDHPITRRLGGFWRVTDESYDQLWISDGVDVLLSTTAFGSENRIAWIGPSESRRVVFVQPGHGEEVLTDPEYLMLLEDALRWVARPSD